MNGWFFVGMAKNFFLSATNVYLLTSIDTGSPILCKVVNVEMDTSLMVVKNRKMSLEKCIIMHYF